ncbi:hypothetical protein Tco_0941554 [Tanacetum coccineum]|uniref:Uncharacterized protein n=1 Tax=Tanacetum coccineum TaxID=301880 RepID=A0ABQ5DS34_9ASTR
MWKPTINTPPLPPIIKTMHERPSNNKIKHPSKKENEHSVSRVGRFMTCTKCWRTSHNKARCTNPTRDKRTIKADKPPRKTNSLVYTTYKNRRVLASVMFVLQKLKYGKQVRDADHLVELCSHQAEVGVTKQGIKGSHARDNARRKKEKRRVKHNGRIYQDWDDLLLNPFFEEELNMDKKTTLSELTALDEAIAEHNEGLPSNS